MKLTTNINDFEDDFFAPSEEVWSGVQKSLPPEKKPPRWRFVLVIPILILGLYFLNPNFEQKQVRKTANETSFMTTNLGKESTQVSVFKSEDSDQGAKVDLTRETITSADESSLAKLKNLANVESSITSGLFEVVQSAVAISRSKRAIAEQSILYAESKVGGTNISSNTQIQSSKQEISSMSLATAAKPKEAALPIEDLARDLLNVDYLLKRSSKIKLVNRNYDLSNRKEYQCTLKDESKTVQQRRLYFALSAAKSINLKTPEVSLSNPLSETVVSSELAQNFELGLSRVYMNASNRWSVGIGYSDYSYQVAYDLNIGYDLSVEENHGLISTNHLSHNLPTGIGAMSTDLTLERATDSPVLHNENVNLSLQSEIDYNVYQVVLGYDRFVTNSIYVGGNLSPSTIAITSNSHTIKSNHTFVTKREFASQVRLMDIGSLQGGMRLGYMKSIGARQAIDLSLQYRQSLLGRNDGQFVGLNVSYLFGM